MSQPVPDAFDPDFLGVRAPLPVAPADAPLRELPSTHFTVLLDPRRRLAAATGVNIDGASLLDVGRGDDWHLDPRVGADEQAGPELYARNDLDRGHLVRRRDPVWGPADVARRANVDTFAYPNAAPQAAEFNQSKELWNGLEDHVLEHARAYGRRLTVLTGTVLDAQDPVYRGIGIPRRFWKVVAWAEVAAGADPGTAPRLATTAYVLDQTPQLDEIDLRAATAQALAAGEVPPLGPFRTFQVPVRDVEELTRLDLGPLVAADRLATVSARDDSGAERPGWVPLASTQDIRL